MEMESPNSSKPQSTDTSPAQESPVFSYISNLSPLVEKASTVTQDFQGLGSPPLVFTSPRHKFQTQTTYLKRAIFHGLSATQLSRQNECCEENSVSPTECQYSTDVVNMDSIDSNCPSESTTKSSEYVDQPRDAKGTNEPSVNVDDEHNKRITEEIATSLPPLTRQTEDEDKEDSTIDATDIETEVKDMDVISDHCIKIGQELSLVHAVTNQELEVPTTEFRHQNHWEVENAGQGFPLDQSSHLLSESTQIGEDSGNFVEAAVATLSKPALEVTQHRGILRRCLQFDDAQNQKVTPNYTAHNPEDSMGPQSLKKPLRLANEKWDVTLQPVSYPKNNSSLNVMVQKPIGLHLNKIVNLGQSESGSITEKSRSRTSSFTIRGNKLIPIINSPSDSGLSRTDNHRSFSTYTIKTLNHPVALSPVEDESTPSNKRKFNSVIDGVSEEFNKSSVKKKRKTSSDPSDSNGCKRCNCKKSNCLKLYCDCFAAGIYCAGSCACVACLNRPQYEETVLDKRQQIESRNPLAFAPKVVKHLTQPLESSFENNQSLFTPSSARHKRGCNCKKSMCMKKYCECYQANVGCSDGCRCEGCQNVFGRKGDLGMKDVTNDECTGEKADGSSGENFKLLSSGNSLYSSELLNPHHLTPPTPAFQFTDHRKDASEAWFPSGKYVQSPSPDCNAKISETNNEIRDMAPFDPALHYGGNAETVNDFSSENMKFTSDISNHLISANGTKVESFPANRQYSSATSCHWHGSPNTPMASHSGTAKYLQVSMQEETTYVLIDTPTSQDNVKVISPAKKRVSPPRLTEFGSSSSGGVRTGRKFILKAVPSFPPLTPCVSKTAGVEPTDDPQIRSNNN